MIWKHGILQFDRVLLVALLRPTENGQEAQLALLLVQSLLNNADFVARVNETLAVLPPVYWHCPDYLDRLRQYHQNFPEVNILRYSEKPLEKFFISSINVKNIMMVII